MKSKIDEKSRDSLLTRGENRATELNVDRGDAYIHQPWFNQDASHHSTQVGWMQDLYNDLILRGIQHVLEHLYVIYVCVLPPGNVSSFDIFITLNY